MILCSALHCNQNPYHTASLYAHYSEAMTNFTILSWVGEGGSGTVGSRSPRCFFWVLPKRSIPKPDIHGKDIMQLESLGTDMLWELMHSNNTRYHIELINRSCGGWLVSTLL